MILVVLFLLVKNYKIPVFFKKRIQITTIPNKSQALTNKRLKKPERNKSLNFIRSLNVIRCIRRSKVTDFDLQVLIGESLDMSGRFCC
jgi:hypothetical protein